MQYTRIIILSFLLQVLFSGCDGQEALQQNISGKTGGVIGGPFETGEYIYYGLPQNINSVDTSRGWNQNGQKLLITGKIYKLDGKTPAPGVIVYYYHTDIHGIYDDTVEMDERAARHGYIRGWVKSDEDGNYAIYTVRPAAYPGSTEPAHIHPTIKEPEIDQEYYIDSFVFDDDKLLTAEERRSMENRGGSGVLRVLEHGDLQISEHNIILGLNIPNYPASGEKGLGSGNAIGEDMVSFTPYHAWGPDRGKKVCPVCKYGRHHGIMYFVGNHPNWVEISRWLQFLDDESIKRKKYLKAYFIYGNEDGQRQTHIDQLEELGRELDLQSVALTIVPSFADTASDIHYNRIDPDVENTFILYRQSNIIDKFINLKPTTDNFSLIAQRLDETTSKYFDLSVPAHD